MYHLTTRGETSWYGFAKAIFNLGLKAGFKLTLSSKNVNPILTREYPTPASRPQNSRLDSSKLERALNIELPDWESQLDLTFNECIK